MSRIFFLIFFTLHSSLFTFAQGVECEDTCSHIHGIDISHYQGKIFWETVANNTPMAYVYIKATEGGNRIDQEYENNILTAHQYGLKVGSYHFYRAKIEQETQLANFVLQCRPSEQDLIPLIDVPSEQDLIPLIDVEVASGLGVEEFCDSLFKFLELVEHYYRQKPLIYSGTNFYNKYLAGKMDRYPLMIAQYRPPEPVLKDGNDYLIWQYTGKGRLRGINGASWATIP